MGRLATFIAILAACCIYKVPRYLVPPAGTDTFLFFDGVCNLCDGFVNWVADHDSSAKVRFGAIQRHGDLMVSMGAGAYAEGGSEALSTMVLVQSDKVFVRSEAALRTIAQLDSPWNLLSVFYVIPAPIRDAGYKLVARYRYRVFGQVAECRRPTPQLEKRFLDYRPPENAIPFATPSS